jgi:hypothetical protein
MASLHDGVCGLSDGSVEGDWRLPYFEELQGIGTDPPETWVFAGPKDNFVAPGEPFVGVLDGTSTTGSYSYAWY